jgi:hypothetical protein
LPTPTNDDSAAAVAVEDEEKMMREKYAKELSQFNSFF